MQRKAADRKRLFVSFLSVSSWLDMDSRIASEFLSYDLFDSGGYLMSFIHRHCPWNRKMSRDLAMVSVVVDVQMMDSLELRELSFNRHFHALHYIAGGALAYQVAGGTANDAKGSMQYQRGNPYAENAVDPPEALA